jgi:hypothetical protein
VAEGFEGLHLSENHVDVSRAGCVTREILIF